MNKKAMGLILAVIAVALVLLAIFGFACYATDSESDSSEDSSLNAQTYEDFFVKDNIIDIHIEIREADWQDMRDYATNEEYHSADITINGITIENAGIRTKGNMTLSSVANSDSDRYSFRIKFNKYVKGQTFLGLDELCLNNGYSDATYMREYLHYEILEQLGMNVPKRSFCNVSINGELFGFYLAVEAIDDTFLEREFGSDYENGNLYKMDMGSTLEYKEDENYSYADLKAGTDKSLAEFKGFVKKLHAVPDGEKGDIEDFLNVESALKYIASNTVLCNYDSYNGNNHHNFYLYEDENGVFTVVPWDFNMSFGGFNGNNSNVGIDTPFISGSLETLPLIGKLLSVDEYKEAYYGYIQEIMAMLESFESRVTELKEIIRPYVENDPTSFYSPADFEKSTSLQGAEPGDSAKNREPERQGGGRPFGGTDSIINCIKDRLENLNAQFAGTAEKVTQTTDSRGNGHRQNDFAPPAADRTPEDFKPPEFENNGGNNSQRPSAVQPPENDTGENREPAREDFSGGRDWQPGGNPPENKQPDDRNGHENNRNDIQNEKSRAVRVHVNGHIIAFESAPFVENETVWVGLRGVLEALDATVTWDEETQTVTTVKGDTAVTLSIGSDTAFVNGEAQTLTDSPVIRENSTMIPISVLSEQLGLKVSWDSETRLLTVISK